PGHAIAARVVHHNKIYSRSLFALGRNTRACTATDYGFAPCDHALKFLHQCLAIMPCHNNSSVKRFCVMIRFMEKPDLQTETHIFGDDTRIITVRAEHCEALAARHIAHVAVIDAAAPYTIVRTHLSGAFLQVCLGGEGQTLLDGNWRSHTVGLASFAPAHVLHAFHCL